MLEGVQPLIANQRTLCYQEPGTPMKGAPDEDQRAPSGKAFANNSRAGSRIARLPNKLQ